MRPAECRVWALVSRHGGCKFESLFLAAAQPSCRLMRLTRICLQTAMNTIDKDTPVQTAPAPPSTSIWEALKDAVRGSEADYTKIGLGKAIFLLSVPMILELVMESAFAIADIYFVGKLGPSAVATVGLTETYLYILYSLAMGMAM